MSIIDEIIQDAMNRGEFDNLPGQGKPLKIEGDPYTPDHLRLAHKILKENDLAPDWIEEGKAIEKAVADWRKKLETAVRRRRTAATNAERAWEAALTDLRREAASLNGRILNYNLKLPPGVTHRFPIRLETELARLG